ncbi:transposase family protein [Streptomyces sp. NPDC053750]|uniref:transposase family protein n=1 Tax=Streptomyces sp. NPDC053750 TaxID=3365714 RepID=UPI0037CF1C3D
MAGRRRWYGTRLAFTDRLLVTLVYLRHRLPHAAPAKLYGVDRPTLFGAIREARRLTGCRCRPAPHRLEAPAPGRGAGRPGGRGRVARPSSMRTE